MRERYKNERCEKNTRMRIRMNARQKLENVFPQGTSKRNNSAQSCNTNKYFFKYAFNYVTHKNKNKLKYQVK